MPCRRGALRAVGLASWGLLPLLAAWPTAAPAAPLAQAPAPKTAGPAEAQPVIGLILRPGQVTPYDAALRQGAEQAARALGARLIGTVASEPPREGNAAQLEALELLLAAGARAILIAPDDSRAIAPALQRARDRGVLVIALDAAPEPASAADAVIATDNRRAGVLIGRYARAAWEARGRGRPAQVALLDLPATSGVGAQRRQGFLEGFGLPPTPPPIGVHPAGAPSPGSHPVVCRLETRGDRPSARQAMETCLRQAPGIDVVMAAQEPAAAGAVIALAEAGRGQDTLVVSVDGSCQGVRGVADGFLAATAQQFPIRMGAAGVEAAEAWLRRGTPPAAQLDTGVSLVAARPMAAVPSADLQAGLAACWGAVPEIAAGITAYAYPVNRRTVALVEEAASAIARRGEALLPDLDQPGSRWRQGGQSVFVLAPDGKDQLPPPDLDRRLRERMLAITAVPPGRGWVHERLPGAGAGTGGAPWRSSYVVRAVTPAGRPLVLGSATVEPRIENAFVVQEVEAAAALIAQRGTAAFAALRDPRGRFVFRDVYVFVIDSDGVELVNPAFPALEGRNLIALQDAEGKEAVRDELLLALRQGSGWTSSLWPHPRTGRPTRKLSYVKRVVTPEGRTLVVGAGVYEQR